MNAFRDIKESALKPSLGFKTGLYDIKGRYSRSLLGPLWITISMGIMICSLGFLYSSLFGLKLGEYIPFLTLGFAIWTLISGIINESSNVLIQSAGLIKQSRFPITSYFLRVGFRNIFVFFHNLIIFFIVAIIFDVQFNWGWLLAIPALLICSATSICIGLGIGVLSARFRDLPVVTSNVLQVSFFLTPIIWKSDLLQERAYLLNYNPFYYLVDFIRLPLLGAQIPPEIWFANMFIIVASASIAGLIFFYFFKRIAYWA